MQVERSGIKGYGLVLLRNARDFKIPRARMGQGWRSRYSRSLQQGIRGRTVMNFNPTLFRPYF